MIWWWGYVESDEQHTKGRFAKNLVVALQGDLSEEQRQAVLQQARVDPKEQAQRARVEIEAASPKKLTREDAIALAKDRAAAQATGKQPKVSQLGTVSMSDQQLERTALLSHTGESTHIRHRDLNLGTR